MSEQTPLPGIDPGLPPATAARRNFIGTHDDIDMYLDESLGMVEALYEVLFHRGERHHAPNDFRAPITLVNLLDAKLRAVQELQARQFEDTKVILARSADATTAKLDQPALDVLYSVLDDANRLHNFLKAADNMTNLMGMESGPVFACLQGALEIAGNLSRVIDELSSGAQPTA